MTTTVDVKELLSALSIPHYLKSLGFDAFDWQNAVASSSAKRKLLLCSRQAGKSTIVSAIPCHSAKYFPGSLSVVIAPSEKQATEDMIKIKGFIAHDETYPELKRNGADLIELNNGSRIIVVAATDQAARGYSRPRVVLLDEASRIDDTVYKSGVVPMLNNSPNSEIIMLSTPFGRMGFFYNTWLSSNRYEKYFVKSPFVPDEAASYLKLRYADETESEFQERMKIIGVKAWYSPNHADLEYQQSILDEVGEKQYRQEFCCEFVEQDGQIFRDADIDRLFRDELITPRQVEGDWTSAPSALVPKKIAGGKYF